MTVRCRGAALVAGALTLFDFAPRARAQVDADVVKQCAGAYEETQRLQAKGQLLAARDRASACSALSCPAEIVSYCAKLAEEIDASVPSIVVVVTDGSGRDLPGLDVSIDGRRTSAGGDGRPLRLDPGAHVVRAVSAEGASAEIEIVLRSGEQNRRVEVRMPDDASSTTWGADESIGYVPSAVAFGVGGAGLVLGAITGLLALDQDAELEEVCAGPDACEPQYADEIDRADTLGTLSTIGFVVGGVGVGTGIVLAIVAASTGVESPVEPTTTGLLLRF